MTKRIDPGKLIAARSSRAMSQEELAAACGLSVRTVQRIEAGGTASLESTKALTALLGDVRVVGEGEEAGQGEPHRTTLTRLRWERRLGALGASVGGVLSSAGILSGYLSGRTSSADAGLANSPIAKPSLVYCDHKCHLMSDFCQYGPRPERGEGAAAAREMAKLSTTRHNLLFLNAISSKLPVAAIVMSDED